MRAARFGRPTRWEAANSHDDFHDGPERPNPMTSHNSPPQPPARRDLTDPRSSGAPAAQYARKMILNDARSTHSRPA